MKKGIIFDLDGVLVSTDHLHYLAWKQLADKHNIYFDQQINNRLRGVSRTASLDIILERSQDSFSAMEKEQMCKFKNDIYVDLLDGLTRQSLLKNVDSTLNQLKKLKVKTAIGSASKNAAKILQLTGILDSFDAVVDGNDLTHSKPHPEVFLVAAQRLLLLPSECIVVEDSLAGIEAGHAGGFVCCAIGDAQNHPNADYKIDDISQLLEIIF